MEHGSPSLADQLAAYQQRIRELEQRDSEHQAVIAQQQEAIAEQAAGSPSKRRLRDELWQVNRLANWKITYLVVIMEELLPFGAYPNGVQTRCVGKGEPRCYAANS